jgi:hypothetical protein
MVNIMVAYTFKIAEKINAYYPFGMLIPGLSLISLPGKYNSYKYGSKELQRDFGLFWGNHGIKDARPHCRPLVDSRSSGGKALQHKPLCVCHE